MKITAQEEYGLRCLLQLARRHGTTEPVTVREIAASEGISVAYAEKLLHRLSKFGLAESVRGVKGGFRLTRSPEAMTVGDAVRALGSFLTHAAICQRYTGEEARCVHNKNCGLRSVWSTVNYHILRLFDSLPLAILLKGERDSRQQIMEIATFALAAPRAGASRGGFP